MKSRKTGSIAAVLAAAIGATVLVCSRSSAVETVYPVERAAQVFRNQVWSRVVGVFRENAAEASRQITVRDLAPSARYAVLRGPDGTRVAEMTGAELETKGFRVEFANRIDGELYEIRRLD